MKIENYYNTRDWQDMKVSIGCSEISFLTLSSNDLNLSINSVYYWFVFNRFERCSYVGLMCDAKLLINWNRPI